MREIARGRIWAGAEALIVGLIDELGDLQAGIQAASALAGVAPDAPV